jgi:hypothetical protein
MRKLIVLAVAMAGTAVPSGALASSASIAGQPAGIGSVQPNGKVVQYRLTYTDFAGPVLCAGTHHGSGLSAGNLVGLIPGSFDSFTCTSTIGALQNGFVPGQVITIDAGWSSDYFSQLGLSVQNAHRFTLTVSSDGTSYSGVVTY